MFFASLAASKDVAQSVLLGILSGPQPLLGSPVAFMLFFLSLLCWLLFFSLTFRCLRDLRITPHLLLSFLILLSHCFKYHLDTGDSHIYLPRQNLSSELKTLLLAHLTALISHQLLKTNMIGPSKPLALIFFPISVNGNSFLEVLASAITTTIITQNNVTLESHPSLPSFTLPISGSAPKPVITMTYKSSNGMCNRI